MNQSLKLLTLCLLAFAILLNTSLSADKKEAPAPAAQQPNIVYLMTDDQRWDCFGCYGRPEFKTKNIDELAAQGAVFDNAYYAVAICMPSRATVMTGRYMASHQSGFTHPYNKPIPRAKFKDSYPAQLKKAGYRTGFVGKFGFDVDGGKPSLESTFDYFDAGGKRWADNEEGNKGLEKIHVAGRDPKERTLKKGDSMLNFLNSQPEGKPFVLSISFDAVKNDKDEDMYGPDTEVFADTAMTVPNNWVEGENKDLPEVIQENARGYHLHVSRTSTPELYQTLARRFATQGITVDNQVGRLREKLAEMGILDNTIIIYTSDNGRFHGSLGLYDKALLYDEAVKAPLIIWDGRTAGENTGHRVEALASSVDFAPTMLSLAGVPIPDSMQGHALTGILNQSEDLSQWRDAVFMENLFINEIHSTGAKAKKANTTPDFAAINTDIVENNRSYRSRGVRTDRYKYFVYYEHTPVIEELYDLEKDPHEQKNLADNPEYISILESLRVKTEELHTEFSANDSE